MKRLKLKSWVVPALYVVSLTIIFASAVLMGKMMMDRKDDVKETIFVPSDILEDDTKPVVEEITNVTVNHPYLLEGVKVAKDFYDREASEESQINSLIFYKNTYMENTGVLYTNGEKFDVVSVLDGTVTSITDDEILGKVVEVTHSTELITIYHCLSEVNVAVGDSIKQNDVIGVSGKVNIDKGYENALLFEVNYQGQIINPNKFYLMKISDLVK